MRPFRASVLLFANITLLSTLTFAVQPDRIAGAIDSSQMVSLRGNVHGLARPDFDLGRADNAQRMSVSLVFKPSAAQQNALTKLLKDQQDSTSPIYHKWLTPGQFADRFGLTRNDVSKVVSWLQSQGFTVTRVANSRNQVFFEGTIAQVESTFRTEIHNYLINGEMHFANATEPSLPAALAATALGLQNLHNFEPRPRAHVSISGNIPNPNFTSHVSGKHFLTPGDFATIYDIQGLYTSGFDGTGQTIAVTGQSSISLTDVANYRSAAGLPAKSPTLTLVPNTGSSAVCAGDEAESDLDVEFSGGVAKNASIILVYAGLGTGTTCSNRTAGAFDALQYAIDQKLAPVISNSYGNCERNIGSSFALTMQGWAQQANTQGQTIISASGDSGAADCDFRVTSATQGFAVDMPAAIPEVTGAGGTEFNGDAAATVTGTPPNSDAGATTYWGGTTGQSDNIPSALSYIPEMGWNDSAFDIANRGNISASGGGKSIFFAKPSWQTSPGVPNDGQRDVPDISASSSADHDGYLFCTSDSGAVTCVSGFRDGQGNLSVVGGTSAAAPTLSGVFTLIDQYLVTNGFQTKAGLGNINPSLYRFGQFSPTALHDVTTGNNIVPCSAGTPSCPTTGTLQYGFSAGTGYDQVTGLGSIDGQNLAVAWGNSLTPSTVSVSPSATKIVVGQSETFTVTVSPSSTSGVVSLFNNGSATVLGTAKVSGGSATFATTLLPPGTNSITATYTGNFANSTTPSAVSITVTKPTYTLTPSVSTLTVSRGASSGNTVNLALSSPDGFTVTNGGNVTTVLPVTYGCSLPASEASCSVSPSSPTSVTALTVSVATTAPTAQLIAPLPRGRQICYAVLLPGLFGIVLAAGSRGRAMRVLGLIVVLGCSTLWMGACGGSSVQKNPGTPPGNYTVTVNATTGGASPLAASTSFALVVQ